MEEFDNFIKSHTTFLDNPYVSSFLTVFLVVYASSIAPKLPEYYAKFFDNIFVKFLMFFLIVFLSKKNATLALISSIALIISIMTLNKIKINKEMMKIIDNK